MTWRGGYFATGLPNFHSAFAPLSKYHRICSDTLTPGSSMGRSDLGTIRTELPATVTFVRVAENLDEAVQLFRTGLLARQLPNGE
jgi:hypothetical protein